VSFSASSDKSDYDAGEIINVTAVLETNGVPIPDKSYQLMLPDTSKFNFITNGSYNRSFIDPATNTIVTQTFYRIVLEAKQKGKIKFGSILVDVNNKRYKTEPFNVFIRDNERKSVATRTKSNDVYLNMDVDERSIYKNEPTVVVLRAYSQNLDNLRKVKNIELPKQGNLETKLISSHRSEIDPSGLEDMPTQVLSVFMVFPNDDGLVEIHPVTASVNTYAKKTKIFSNKVKLNVKNLPEEAPESFTNCVGKFDVSIKILDTTNIEVNKPMNVLMKITGNGNFETMKLPQIASSPDYEFYAPKLVSNVKATAQGNVGEILATYILIPKRAGEMMIKTENFAFFDPIEKVYQVIESKVLNLNVFSHDQILAKQSPLEKVNEYTNSVLETVNTPILKTGSLKVKEKNKIHWRTIALNSSLFLVAFVGFLGYRRWKRKSQEQETKKNKDFGSIAETEAEIRSQIQTEDTAKDHFYFLKNMKNNNDFSNFFQTVSELDEKVKNEAKSSSDSEFSSYLTTKFGSSVAEEYKALTQKIQMEKYAPALSNDMMNEVYHEVLNFYSKIIK
jgi:hypothetical protein